MKRALFVLFAIGLLVSTANAQDLIFGSKAERDAYLEAEYQEKVKQNEIGKKEMKSTLKTQFDEQNETLSLSTANLTNAHYVGENGEDISRDEYLALQKRQQQRVFDDIDNSQVRRPMLVDTESVTVYYDDVSEVQDAHKKAKQEHKKAQEQRQKEWNRKPFQKD